MYLKSIEIQGFKSFANKIRFDFHNGITGIVGPNGSGKSNVADAVRWVLGEQRIKQLRGASMQDVIFAGTESRKPLGFAYVAITLDNSDHKLPTDYTEVTVARRLYRSGESEYLLNGTACRLRDINELFYDTGIGKEGYSIIGQGQIDKILSDKPEDRRELFDEAVGIVKFKRRKDLTLKKLASEEENMVRVSDILSELEKQVPSLEKQSEKAKIYLREKESLKKLEVNVFLMENSRNLEELEQISEKETIAQDNLDASRTEYDKSGEEYETVRARIDVLEKEIETQRNRVTDAGILRSRIEGDIKVYQEQIRAAQSEADHFQTRQALVREEIRQREVQRDEIKSRKAAIDEQVQTLSQENEKAKETLEALSDRIRAASDREQEIRTKNLELLDERATLRSRTASIETMQAQCEQSIAEAEQNLAKARTDQAAQVDVLKTLREEFERDSGQMKEARDLAAALEEEVAGFKVKLGNEDEALQKARQAYHRERSRLDALINLTERYEGYGGSVRRIMQQKKQEPRVIGVVADLIKTQRQYETAVETALGGSIQNIVVEDTETARRMIDLLKREKAGRATFLPLSGISKPQPFREKKALSEPGVIGLADTLVMTEDKYRPVASFLLGRILIVDNFEHAAAVSRKYNRSLRMVTLEGELFTPGGAISGGTFRNSSNLLGRRREMAELRVQVASLLEEADGHEKAISQIKERRTEVRAKLEENSRRQQELVLHQNTVRMRIAQEQARQEETATDEQALRRSLEELRAKKQDLEARREEAGKALERSGEQEQALSAESEKLTTELTLLREEESRRTQEYSRRETEREVILQKQDFEQQNLARAGEELQRFQSELEELERSLSQGSGIIVRREQEIAELQGQLEGSDTDRGEGERLLKEKNEERDGLSVRLNKLIRHREEISRDVNVLEKECLRLQSRRERLQEQLDSRASYMWEEYEITRSDAAALRDETLTDLEQLRKEISEGRARIKALGSVNVDAIEEYRTLMERYTFLKGQHDDLTEAAASLEKIVAELDEAMRRQFRQQFADIQKAFDRVFKELFGGGQGQLELLEDADILEAGVRVIAQPPGKKLQNMMQLSGGEKALTAIALLFAIQSLKPSPFCLLDEIEAALDESNVGRFAQYLHNLTQSTQFIVITHRRGTMEQADRLYGITMQEKGISAMVSVDLIDDKDIAD